MHGSVRMRGIAAYTLSVFSASICFGQTATEVAWRTDFSRAAREAQESNKPLVISIHAAWCSPCREMQRTTLRDPQLVALLNNECVPLSIDGDEHSKLVAAWRVKSYPTQLIVKPGTPRGEILTKFETKVGPSEYVQAIESAVRRMAKAPADAGMARNSTASPGSGRRIKPAVETPSADQAEDSPPARALSNIAATTPKEDGEIPLALEGHCPVTMIELAEMKRGKASETAVAHGKRYYFTSAKARQRFEADPDRYIPAEDGRCVVTYALEGRWARGKIQFPALFEDRVYFLASDEHRRKFLRDPESFVDERGRALVKSR